MNTDRLATQVRLMLQVLRREQQEQTEPQPRSTPACRRRAPQAHQAARRSRRRAPQAHQTEQRHQRRPSPAARVPNSEARRPLTDSSMDLQFFMCTSKVTNSGSTSTERCSKRAASTVCCSSIFVSRAVIKEAISSIVKCCPSNGAVATDSFFIGSSNCTASHCTAASTAEKGLPRTVLEISTKVATLPSTRARPSFILSNKQSIIISNLTKKGELLGSSAVDNAATSLKPHCTPHSAIRPTAGSGAKAGNSSSEMSAQDLREVDFPGLTQCFALSACFLMLSVTAMPAAGNDSRAARTACRKK
mmetsp:Transcript_53319/g.152848  ORF Transcript_53319/g.152848 Transcript_53319/m.152848 type:complete len:304 (+) Transcript_53319:262-1173(+)